MGKLVGNLAKNFTDINDRVIATKSLTILESASEKYLHATLVCTTPELRGLFNKCLTQLINEHGALAEISVRNKWLEPYNSSKYRLKMMYDRSKHLLHQDQ